MTASTNACLSSLKLLVDRLAQHRSESHSTEDGGYDHINTNLAVRASTAHGVYLLAYAFHDLVEQLMSSDATSTKVRFGVSVQHTHVAALDSLLRFYLLQNCLLSQDAPTASAA